MPSPFPGMDPYLERPGRWPDLHRRLLAYISEVLQPQLRPKYIARIDERVELRPSGKKVVPDFLAIEPPRRLSETRTAYGALIADEPQTISGGDEERRIPFLELIHRATGNVITVIEVLSPSNKLGLGREDYLQKQEDLLNTACNLVEIDLLSGPAVTFARRFRVTTPRDWRYIVSISRAQQLMQVEAYAIPLRERLPRCKIPLLPEDNDAVLDLPAVFTRCYDVGGYDLLLDYRQPPPVELSEAEEKWMAALLEEKGLRTALAQQ